MQIDKQAHFWAGAAIASTAVAYNIAPLEAFLGAVLIALFKEFWDALGYGTPDKWDFVATVLGATVVLPLEII